MEKRTAKEWELLIREAAGSGSGIKIWCKEHGISDRLFYHHCKVLGYIADGRRTDKWNDAAQHTEISGKNGGSTPGELVPVPLRTLEAAAGREHWAGTQARICIQNPSWKIYVSDGVSAETLRAVLEAVCHA